MRNRYNTYFVESEAILAITAKDHAYADEQIASLSIIDRRAFRREVLELYLATARLSVMTRADIDEIMGELQIIADETKEVT